MFDKWIESARQRMFGNLELELMEAEERGEKRRVESFLVRVMPKLMAGIFIFLGLIWIFNNILEKYGMDRVMIVIGVIIILTLRGINKTLNKVS